MNPKHLLLIVVALGTLAPFARAEPPRPHLAAALANPARPEADTARDADRKPAEVLEFFGIEPGMTVAELHAGRGYYAEILAVAVGTEGRVYLQEQSWVTQRYGDLGVSERLKKPTMANVVQWQHDVGSLDLPEAELDAVLLVLFYHDTFWQGVDRKAMNAGVLAALKPGGVFGVVDHHAEAGSGERDVKTLHRGDAAQIKSEILQAGFELDAESDLLRHPEDDRSKNIFDEHIRGKTDRFIYRFRKPGDPQS